MGEEKTKEVIEFEFEKETKNTIRYKEITNIDGIEHEAIIRTIYIKKAYYQGTRPEKIRITLEELE